MRRFLIFCLLFTSLYTCYISASQTTVSSTKKTVIRNLDNISEGNNLVQQVLLSFLLDSNILSDSSLLRHHQGHHMILLNVKCGTPCLTITTTQPKSDNHEIRIVSNEASAAAVLQTIIKTGQIVLCNRLFSSEMVPSPVVTSDNIHIMLSPGEKESLAGSLAKLGAFFYIAVSKENTDDKKKVIKTWRQCIPNIESINVQFDKNGIHGIYLATSLQTILSIKSSRSKEQKVELTWETAKTVSRPSKNDKSITIDELVKRKNPGQQNSSPLQELLKKLTDTSFVDGLISGKKILVFAALEEIQKKRRVTYLHDIHIQDITGELLTTAINLIDSYSMHRKIGMNELLRRATERIRELLITEADKLALEQIIRKLQMKIPSCITAFLDKNASFLDEEASFLGKNASLLKILPLINQLSTEKKRYAKFLITSLHEKDKKDLAITEWPEAFPKNDEYELPNDKSIVYKLATGYTSGECRNMCALLSLGPLSSSEMQAIAEAFEQNVNMKNIESICDLWLAIRPKQDMVGDSESEWWTKIANALAAAIHIYQENTCDEPFLWNGRQVPIGGLFETNTYGTGNRQIHLHIRPGHYTRLLPNNDTKGTEDFNKFQKEFSPTL